MTPGNGAEDGAGGMKLTEAELRRWGCRIGRELRTAVFIGMRGPIGAGKSVLARAIGEGAGVCEAMPSPTFNLIFRYPLPQRSAAGGEVGAATLVHADLYRIETAEELAALAWEEIIADDGAIVLVEWPERAAGDLPEDRWEVALCPDPLQSDLRLIAVEQRGCPAPLPPFPLATRNPC